LFGAVVASGPAFQPIHSRLVIRSTVAELLAVGRGLARGGLVRVIRGLGAAKIQVEKELLGPL
jgi:hypothetical protein